LPTKRPELNPQENVWRFMRDNWLSNRIFKSFDDIVDHDAWNKLSDQPWRRGLARRSPHFRQPVGKSGVARR
jgi:hypothetical protein